MMGVHNKMDRPPIPIYSGRMSRLHDYAAVQGAEHRRHSERSQGTFSRKASPKPSALYPRPQRPRTTTVRGKKWGTCKETVLHTRGRSVSGEENSSRTRPSTAVDPNGRQEVKVLPQGQGHPLRPRSPSPYFNAPSSRSRSLSARRDSTLSIQTKSQPSSKESSQAFPHNRVDTPDKTTADRFKGRKKSALYSQKAKRRTPDPTAVTQYRETSSRMSSELPPITRAGSATSLSRRSSRDSRESSTQQKPVFESSNKPVPMIRQEKPVLISIDSPTQDLVSPRNPTKRSYLSPGSQTTGSSSQSYSNQSNGQQQQQQQPQRQKQQSWGNDVEAGSPGGKLEAIFEKNGIRDTSVSGTAKAEQMRRNTFSFNNLSNLQQNSALTASKRTQSQSNLTKLSAENNNNNRNNTVGKRPAILRYQSDTNLNVHGGSNNIPAFTPRTNQVRATTTKAGLRSSKARPMRTSTKAVAPGALSKEQTLNAQNLKLQNGVVNGATTLDEDSDSEDANERIMQWLIGVDCAGTEHPPAQDIPEDEPPQTDTAIHIVYNGD